MLSLSLSLFPLRRDKESALSRRTQQDTCMPIPSPFPAPPTKAGTSPPRCSKDPAWLPSEPGPESGPVPGWFVNSILVSTLTASHLFLINKMSEVCSRAVVRSHNAPSPYPLVCLNSMVMIIMIFWTMTMSNSCKNLQIKPPSSLLTFFFAVDKNLNSKLAYS